MGGLNFNDLNIMNQLQLQFCNCKFAILLSMHFPTFCFSSPKYHLDVIMLYLSKTEIENLYLDLQNKNPAPPIVIC